MVDEQLAVKDPLTPERIAIGARLIEAVEGLGTAVSAAFWFYEIEGGIWQLYIVSSDVRAKGAAEVYETVQTALASLNVDRHILWLGEVVVAEPSHPVVGLLRNVCVNGARVSAARRIIKTGSRGQYIDDAYVYRMTA